MLDLTNVIENGGPIPNGTYSVIVEKAEITTTKSGGEMIKTQYKVTEGAGQGRVIFDMFNIKNANPQATQIGLSQLKGMLKAFGHKNPNRLESATEIVGLKGQVTTRIEQSPGYDDQAKVKSYKPLVTGIASDGAPIAPAATNGSNPF